MRADAAAMFVVGWLGSARPRRRPPARVSCGSLRGAAACDRPDRHRERARRPDVPRSVPRLLEPVRRRGPRRDHLDLDEEQGAARRHPFGARRLRAGAAEPAEARARVSGRGGATKRRGVGAAGLRHGGGGPRQDIARGRAYRERRPEDDPRPLWVLAWGGANTLAQALLQARATRTRREVEAIVAKLRVYSISDQDDAGPWIRREFPSSATSSRPRPRTASSTTSRPGRASAAIGSTATRREPTSPRSPTSG